MLRTTRRVGLCLGLAIAAACNRTAADHVQRGDKRLAEKQVADAIVEYRAALQKDPQLGETRLKLADLYAEQGDGQRAYQEYIRAADSLPANRDAQLKAGAMLLLGNRFAEAKTRAESVLQRTPRDSQALMLLGNALAGLNDVAGAFRRLNEAIAADPESSLAYSNLGSLQLARGDQRMAEASFKKAINADQNSVSARVALANYYRAQNRDGEAEKVLDEASRVDPRNVQVNSNLVELYIRTGRPNNAEAPLRAIVDVMKNADAQFALAEYYLRMKRYEEAIPILRTLTANPETASLAKARIAAVDYHQGRTSQAHATIDEVLRQEPNSRPALLLKGQLLSTERKFDEALKFLKAAAAADPARDFEPNLVTARIYFARGQVEEAVELYKKVLTANPGSSAAQLGLSQLYATRGEYKTAAEFARAAVTRDPSNVDARFMLVRTLQAAGDIAAAESEIRVLQANLPPSSAVEVQLGMLALSKHNPAAARAAFSKALALGPGDVGALAGLVGLDLEGKDGTAAIQRVEARLLEAPDDRHAWYLAAHLYFRLKDLPRTERALRKTIELDPVNLSAFAMLGGVYAAQGKLDEAKSQFDAWAQQQPRSVAAHTMVAMLLERQNQPAEALKAYQKILEIDPRAAIAANNLAFSYANTGKNLDVALQLAQAAQAQLPTEPEFNDTLGWIYYKKDAPDIAIQHFQVALQGHPTNPSFLYHLGLAYAKQGDDAKAIATLKKALSVSKAFEGAADAKRLLSELTLE